MCIVNSELLVTTRGYINIYQPYPAHIHRISIDYPYTNHTCLTSPEGKPPLFSHRPSPRHLQRGNDIAAPDCHPSRDNGNGRTVRNVIDAGTSPVASGDVNALWLICGYIVSIVY